MWAGGNQAAKAKAKAYFNSSPKNVGATRANPNRYAQKSGREVSNIIFYCVYGLFKLAVIMQKIYRRYKLGFTQDKGFAHLDRVVETCGEIARQAIKKKRFNNLF